MNWKIYRSSNIGGVKADISDDIYNVSGLEIKRNRDQKPIITNCKITLSGSMAVELGTIFHIYKDNPLSADDLVFLVYATKIEKDDLKKTKTVTCFDILYKLKDYYVADISTDWWDGYTPSDTIEYKYLSAPKSRWITVAFLFRVLISKAANIPITYITDDHYRNSMNFLYINETGTYYFAQFQEQMAIQWDQLHLIGKSKQVEQPYGILPCEPERESSITCLDLYFYLCQFCSIDNPNFSFEPFVDSGDGNSKYRGISNEFTPDFPAENIGTVDYAEINPLYYLGRLKRFQDDNSDFQEYVVGPGGTWQSLIFTESDMVEYEANDYTGSNQVKTVRLPNFLFLSRITSAGLGLIGQFAADDFIEQYSRECNYNEAVSYEIPLDFVNTHNQATIKTGYDFQQICNKVTILREVL